MASAAAHLSSPPPDDPVTAASEIGLEATIDGIIVDEDEDDVVHANRRRTPGVNPDANDSMGEDNDADLFGEEGDEDDTLSASKTRRGLDDSDLDSGDDTGRTDRNEEDDGNLGDDTGEQMEVINTMPAEIGVHPHPDPTDGELYLLKVPKFLAFEPTGFQPNDFEAPTQDLHSKTEPPPGFSARKTAMKMIRWRGNPSDLLQVQSNARFIRWSDGSLTLQVANDPATQYLVPGNPLAPPQHNPSKPTPTSTGGMKRKNMQKPVPYSTDKDAFTFLAAPSENSALLRVTNKITTGLQVELSKDASEDAVQRLRDRIEKAQNDVHPSLLAASQQDAVDGMQDPELAKKRAELAEKEQMRAQRKRENQEQKGTERGVRGGLRRIYGAGLNASALEAGDDELGMGAPRRNAGAGRAKPRRQRRGEIYSDDEEAWGQRNRGKEDEYDEEDDFLAPSDEEEEVGEEDEEEDIDEGIVLDDKPGRKRATPDEEDAEGEADSDDGATKPSARSEGSPTSRTKRRRIIEDEDEDGE